MSDESIFPKPITGLPMADIPLPGVRGYMSQSDGHQLLFMEFSQDAEVPEHSHEAQWGIVLEGRIDIVIGGEEHTFERGDRYFVPAEVPHSAKIHAGYADITFFDSPNRYSPR
jgi:ethanolamine utilization protein EutQ (cupin superfamily)